MEEHKMKNIEALSMEELERVIGGIDRSEKTSESISKLIDTIISWFS